MKDLPKKNQKGFTLVEFIIYISIVVVMISALSTLGLNVFFDRSKVEATNELNYNSKIIFEEIIHEVKNAASIKSPSQGNSGSQLSLEKEDGATVVFSRGSNGNATIEKGSGVVNLSTNKVEINSLTFTNLSYDDTPGTLRIEAEIEFKNPENRTEYDATETFYSTVNIRQNN